MSDVTFIVRQPIYRMIVKLNISAFIIFLKIRYKILNSIIDVMQYLLD